MHRSKYPPASYTYFVPDVFSDLADAVILLEGLQQRFPEADHDKIRNIQHTIATEMLQIATTTNLLQWLGVKI